ncbi:hypothetical protein RQP53_14460 [Paucibacter sp. APW11]|uniref:Energy transducer TonB n=1 Tax=Roseateles aquae TaxID=3077235 RepID=A0ABU3PEB6_9BURK|nr:hypothetical protein [Paucibacter sp. APW11]MDT9000472.1 hypothetical protein [Paucibacter sp. APW11]
MSLALTSPFASSTAPGWSERSAWRRWPLLLGVLLLHAAILLSLQVARRAPAVLPEQPRLAINLRLLMPDAPALQVQPAQRPTRPEPASVRPREARDPQPAAPSAQLRLITPASPANATASPAPSTEATPTESAVAPPAESGRLIDSAATRRALRDAARGALNEERFSQASGIPQGPDASQRMAQQVQRSAKGDCLKGEFLGGGLGLLSLPFYLAAEAAGKCSRGSSPAPQVLPNTPEPQQRVGAHASMRDH